METGIMRVLNINYYKETGKYYTSHVVAEPLLDTLEEHVSQLYKSIERGFLPGLITRKWNGYILLELEQKNNIGEITSSVSCILDLKGYKD